MMYLLSVGANLILKHFAIKRANEMMKLMTMILDN